jgi:hypothetical protein
MVKDLQRPIWTTTIRDVFVHDEILLKNSYTGIYILSSSKDFMLGKHDLQCVGV